MSNQSILNDQNDFCLRDNVTLNITPFWQIMIVHFQFSFQLCKYSLEKLKVDRSVLMEHLNGKGFGFMS